MTKWDNYFMKSAQLSADLCDTNTETKSGIVFVKDQKICTTGHSSSYQTSLVIDALLKYEKPINTLKGSQVYMTNSPNGETIIMLAQLGVERIVYNSKVLVVLQSNSVKTMEWNL